MSELLSNVSTDQQFHREDLDLRINQLISHGYSIDAMDIFKRAFNIFKDHAGSFIAYMLIILLGSLISFIPVIGFLVSFALIPMYVGPAYVTSKIIKGEHYEFNDFFYGYQDFGNLFLLAILKGIILAFGFVFFIIPGIYLVVAYTFAIFFIFFHKTTIWEGLEASRKLITARWFEVFVFLLLAGLVVFAGMLFCGIGILVAAPVVYIATYLLFYDVFVSPFDEEDDLEDLSMNPQEGEF